MNHQTKSFPVGIILGWVRKLKSSNFISYIRNIIEIVWKISFMNISWDDQQEDFPDEKVIQNRPRQNSQMAIDPRQTINKKLMASLSSGISDELDNDVGKVSFI